MPADPGRPGLKLALLLALFVALTGLGLWWAVPEGETLRAALHHATKLDARTHVLLASLALALIGAEMLRLRVFAHAIGEHIGVRAALDATIANNFFSWITPGSALGEPASTYMLARHGVSWDAAVLISFAKFATSFVFILGASCGLLALGHGPAITPLVVAPLATAIAIGALLMLALIIGAYAPLRASRAVNAIAARFDWRVTTAMARVAVRSIERLAAFRQTGAPGSLAMLSTHVIYYGIFVAIVVVLADAFAASSLTDTAATAVIYQGFLYLAPTPGGAGLGEASADVFFGELLPAGGAFAVVILFRSLTFYFHVALGLVYLPLRGALRAIVSRSHLEGP